MIIFWQPSLDCVFQLYTWGASWNHPSRKIRLCSMSRIFLGRGNKVHRHGIYKPNHYSPLQHTMPNTPYSHIRTFHPLQEEPCLPDLSFSVSQLLSFLPFFHNPQLIYIRFSFRRRNFKYLFSRSRLYWTCKINLGLWAQLPHRYVFRRRRFSVFRIHPNPRLFSCSNPSPFLNHGK